MSDVLQRTARDQAVPGPALEWLSSFEPAILIDNRWVPARSGTAFETTDPATGQVLALVAAGDQRDVDDAVRSARRAFEEGEWPDLGSSDRARLLRRLAGLMEENLAQLAELESLDNGMPISRARMSISKAIESIHYFAGSAALATGDTVPSDPSFLKYSLREPLGVCAGITPWNVPVLMAISKIVPAVATGNTVILKPAEQTSLTTLRLGELVVEAGFPPGVVNVVTGFGHTTGSALSEHPDVDKISFTGSTAVGKRITEASAGNLKRVTLELGGKSPNIVFGDANLDAAVPAAVAGFCTNAGQICYSGTRLFVQESIKDEFVERLVAAASAIKMGDPLDTSTEMGPLASKPHFDRVCAYLALGAEEGATALLGGAPLDRTGYFVPPTIFDGVENTMRIAREEIFGPVLSVISFADEDEAIRLGNDTEYGLAAAVWTSDVTRAHRVMRRLRTGTVWINNTMNIDSSMPFGGYKQSGIGRQAGPNWYEHYTQEKAVYVKL